MNTTIEIQGKPVRIEISRAAGRELGRRQTPLEAEMELYFSCLVRKKVRFRDAGAATEGIPVSDKLRVSFRPVMTVHCGTDYEGEEPPLTDFPIIHRRPYIPQWLYIDYRAGKWVGEFGYAGSA